jgi:hypothetical protein
LSLAEVHCDFSANDGDACVASTGTTASFKTNKAMRGINSAILHA